MPTRERPADRARRSVRIALRRVSADIRDARVGAGLSQRLVAHTVGQSHSQVGRLERGELGNPSIEFVAACCGVVGLELAIRSYPAGDPLRDRAHAALLARLRAKLHASLRWRTEVPLPIAGDLRAWDAVIGGQGWQMPVEAETVLTDSQALERKLALKLRDGGFDHVVLLVADTSRNRDALAAMPMAARFSVSSRAVLTALRNGRDPGGSGIVVL